VDSDYLLSGYAGTVENPKPILGDPPYNVEPSVSLDGSSPLRNIYGELIKVHYGTVGLILRLFKNGESIGLYALTNYHVIRLYIPGWQTDRKEARVYLPPAPGSKLERKSAGAQTK
jgi:hypothetical protein